VFAGPNGVGAASNFRKDGTPNAAVVFVVVDPNPNPVFVGASGVAEVTNVVVEAGVTIADFVRVGGSRGPNAGVV
jgi:hypothetical protein